MASPIDVGSPVLKTFVGKKEENAFFRKRPSFKQSFSIAGFAPPGNMSMPRASATLIVLTVVWKYLSTPSFTPGTCGGHVHPAFQEVKDVFCQNVAAGKEPGGSFAVYRQGQPLINLWGGYADQGSRKQWKKDTLSQAWSSTKGVTAVVMALLVDRGLLAYNKPVCTYWPEFAVNGKENITVAQLLSHQAGLLTLGRQLSLMEYRDNWQEIEQLMAQQKPAWTPGVQIAYHAYTFGMYADALVRKVDTLHRNISQFFRDEIAKPLDLDFYIGLPLDQFFRSARGTYVTMNELFVDKFLLKPSMWVWLPEVLLNNLLFNSLTVFDFMYDMDKLNDADLQSVGLSSSHGFGTAGSLAKLFDFLANDGSVRGTRLLSTQQIKALSTSATDNIPVIAAPNLPVAMGMIVEKNVMGQPIFGHRGYGGQNAFADPTHGIGVTYITNFNSRYSDSDDPRALELLQVLYKCIEQYHSLPDDDK